MAADEATNTGPFSALPEAEVYRPTQRHFALYPLLTEVKGDDEFISQQIGGRLFRTGYELPINYEPFHVLDNYKARVQEMGGEILFECRNDACGDEYKVHRFISPSYTSAQSSPHILTAKFSTENKQTYTSIYTAKWAAGVGIQLDVIEVIPEPLDLLAVKSDYFDKGIQAIEVEDKSHKDMDGSQDHPMIARLPGAYIRDYQQFDFGQTKVMSNYSDGKIQIRNLEGRITDIGYELPRSYSEYEVNANYQSALKKLGFLPLFECQGETGCGSDTDINYAIKPIVTYGNDDNQFYGLYKLSRQEENVYAMTYILGFSGGLWANLRIIEESTLKDDRLVIDLEGLTDKMAQTGHVALDGLLFEFDKDVMLPEAAEVVSTVATYLKQHPKQKFYVVGHTDDQGKQVYNQQLSEKRAQAVITELTKNHGIPASQLTAAGVGEYSPVANNMTDEGKKQNRRVELVLRSDKK
ncbi:DUF4892 domain-containing protein [Shewanella submarina]|uniref:DUF4892 domain-containing protein n=1 Tax=Shewanella submarina TaxID=2016376 RepID=A0ABV7G940_9GAMM|nr:OmpA family protein [Shewanella submarina]MCL1037393.1 DUF4892 domain-containing protein [Shewanella submarina]